MHRKVTTWGLWWRGMILLGNVASTGAAESPGKFLIGLAFVGVCVWLMIAYIREGRG